ncbi:MAG TPA: hypothetical protein VH372_11015 [Actinospica sp.]|jgi:hypothetical protein|nr:hypothetical protein [Actinospica sp.]
MIVLDRPGFSPLGPLAKASDITSNGLGGMFASPEGDDSSSTLINALGNSLP